MVEQKAIRGVLTETCLDQAEADFPGIKRLYLSLPARTLTFLELVWIYLGRRQPPAA